MSVPFSKDACLDVFTTYNTAGWPVALMLWIATLAGAIQVVRGQVRGAGLAVHWGWYFAAIKLAARCSLLRSHCCIHSGTSDTGCPGNWAGVYRNVEIDGSVRRL